MRIDDYKRIAYDPTASQIKRPDAVAKPSTDTNAQQANNDAQTRAERIASLKQQFASGQPIDVNKLASKLVESGILFDEKA